MAKNRSKWLGPRVPKRYFGICHWVSRLVKAAGSFRTWEWHVLLSESNSWTSYFARCWSLPLELQTLAIIVWPSTTSITNRAWFNYCPLAFSWLPSCSFDIFVFCSPIPLSFPSTSNTWYFCWWKPRHQATLRDPDFRFWNIWRKIPGSCSSPTGQRSWSMLKQLNWGPSFLWGG